MSFGFGFGFPSWRTLAGGFSPAALFVGGQQGFFYDPSDLSTLFQDSAGTTPVTGVEQVVGLMLDKSQGLVLGPELVTNGTFDTNLTGWTTPANAANTQTWSAGALRLTRTSATTASSAPVSTTIGKTYQVSVSRTLVSGDLASAYVKISNTADASAAQIAGITTSGIFTATATTTYVMPIIFPNVAVVDFDNISVRELPGNHASSTGAARPTLSALVNLLTKTEEFTNSYWGTIGASVVNTSATTDPLGGTAAQSITETTANSAHLVYPNSTSTGPTLPTAANSYVYSFYAKANGRNFVVCNFQTVSGSTSPPYAIFNLNTGVVESTSNGVGGSSTTANMTFAGNGWWRCVLNTTFAGGLFYGNICLSDSATPSFPLYNRPTYTGDGTSGIYIWGADLRATNDGVGIPAYQRVNTATDYDSSGFPLYLSFGGTQAMSTGSIDFTATDKMSVFAGVRKLTTAVSLLVELSATVASNISTFGVGVNGWNSAGARYGAGLRGNTVSILGSDTPANFASPITNVLTTQYNIAGATNSDKIKFAINTANQSLSFSGSIGGGNFGTYPLFVGSRGGSVNFFNGRIYSLIGVGSAVSAGNISATESWVNGRTKAY